MGKKKVDYDTILKAYEMYKNGESFTSIGKHIGVSRKTIVYWFDKYGFEYDKKKPTTPSKLNAEQIKEICNLYENGLSSLEIAKKFNVNYKTVLRKLEENNVIIRSNKVNSRKYNINHNYFNEIDTEEKAYWLGFIYADGYILINNGQKYFGISLSSKDVELLYKLNKCLESSYEIKTYKSNGYGNGNEYCRLLITSNKIVDDLMKHGVLENKTNILKPPNIKYELIRHFIRGYIDGDGSIYKTSNGFNITILGTERILNYIIDYFMENNLVKKRAKICERRKGQIVKYFKYGGNQQVEKILNHIYNGSNIHLERKFNVYKELLNHNSRL